ncbi:MAG: PD-(D/E)XK nuclease family protein, partial [Prevotellaceae bacterium]|nr:PD-(D/E)XK nuclease family protein [Prevotellaceae bacterium]
ASHQPRQSHSIIKEKTPEMLRRLYDKYDVRRYNGVDTSRDDTRRNNAPIFSPSALNTYLDCRLKFYYHYVAGLKPVDEVTAEIGSALFGTIFHASAQHIYMDLTRHGNEVRKEDLDRLLKEERQLDDYVYNAFKVHFFHAKEHERPQYNGTQLIHAKVISYYLQQLLRMDREYAPFRIEALEQEVKETLRIATPLGELQLNVGGIVDRMDIKEGRLRIIDYKTGGEPKAAESIAQLFTPDEKRPGYIFQTFLYAALLCRKQPLQVAPSLLYIHKAASKDYSPVIVLKTDRQGKEEVTDFALYEAEFRERLIRLLQEIYDPETPFTQTEAYNRCAYCDFKRLCKR